MTQAAQTIPAVTIHRSVAFARLLARRQAIRAAGGQAPTLDVMVARIVALSLKDYELLNGSWVEDPPAVRVHPARHVAVAVDTPNGLTIVVLHAADDSTEAALEETFRSMVERAKVGRAVMEDVEGATFTITNLGGLGVEAFSPIITPPQVAVLGLGAVAPAPDADRRGTLSLTFDHRVVDGAYAARFLGDVARRIGEEEQV
jgi:pyruvate dehydrogenase E2 component (dihydrolipoamide acetyltransferase)